MASLTRMTPSGKKGGAALKSALKSAMDNLERLRLDGLED
jgi:hypothetical protein